MKFQTNLGALATDPTLESSILQTVARICRRCHKALFWLLSADSQMSNRVLVDGLGGKKHLCGLLFKHQKLGSSGGCIHQVVGARHGL